MIDAVSVIKVNCLNFNEVTQVHNRVKMELHIVNIVYLALFLDNDFYSEVVDKYLFLMPYRVCGCKGSHLTAFYLLYQPFHSG